MPVTNLNELIYNDKMTCNLYILQNPTPQVNLKNNTFFYLSTGSQALQALNKNDDGNNFYGGTVIDKQITFYRISTPFAEYNNSTELLQYTYIPNHKHCGVAIACIQCLSSENFLISSGQLSGCTVCSMYVKEFNRIHFFHVGKASDFDKQPYPQNLKNVDLYNAIALLTGQNTINNGQFLTDEQLLYNLYKLLNIVNYTIQMNIFIRADGNNTHSVNCESVSLKTINSGIYLRYYTNYAQMLTTMCKNQLYSVHYFVTNRTGIPYNEVKRKNYIIQP